MPSAESLALTNAIRHAADMRSSGGTSHGSGMEEENEDFYPISYYIKRTWKQLDYDDNDFKNFLLSGNGLVYILDTDPFRRGIAVAPESVFQVRQVFGFYETKSGYELRYKGYSLGHFIRCFEYGKPKKTCFYDENTVEAEDRVFISKSKDSIRNLVKDIMSTANFKYDSIMKMQFDGLIQRLKEL